MQGIDFTGHEKAETTLRLAKAGSHYYPPGVLNQREDSVSGPPGRKESWCTLQGQTLERHCLKQRGTGRKILASTSVLSSHLAQTPLLNITRQCLSQESAFLRCGAGQGGQNSV